MDARRGAKTRNPTGVARNVAKFVISYESESESENENKLRKKGTKAMNSNFYKNLAAAVKGVKVEGVTRVAYAPSKKSAVKRGDKSRVIESGFILIATTAKGKTPLADAVKLDADISALRPFFGAKNKNRAIVAVYALQSAWGLHPVVSEETAETADATIAMLEDGVAEYERKFREDAEFRAAEVGKMVASENSRHEKRLAKLNEKLAVR